MSKLYLKNVTLVAVSSIKIEETIFSLLESMKEIDYYDVLLISHEIPKNLPEKIKFKKCLQIKSIQEYNRFMLFDLSKFINSDFALVVQYDGYVLRPYRWDDVFLNYDYIGAPWRRGGYFTDTKKAVRVGNGGFSLRSKKLLNVFNDLNLSFVDFNIDKFNEDGVICVYFREELEKYGIRFAPVSIASKFSCEEKLFDSDVQSFGFHTYKSDFKTKFKNIVKLFFYLLNFKFHKNIKKNISL